jgi:hypothetical protein
MRTLTIATLGFALLGPPVNAQVKQLKPGFNLFSPQQDIQMGQEASAEVERTMPVVSNAELSGYLTRIGGRLAKSKRAGTFPFKFSVINDKSINAFALPGGPVYVHTGLLAAIDNESELAGVLAHEMSHVALRHGTHQASKANLIQLPAALASAVIGQGSIWASLAQLGIGLGAQSVLLKYSRDAERDADLNGAQIMNDSGYDPVQMATFFQKLEAEGQRDNSKLANFLSDHPTPGNRVGYVQDQNKYLPKVTYSETEPATVARVKSIVAALPPPPPPKAAAAGVSGAAEPATVRPSGRYRQYQGRGFSFLYPDNWETFGAQDSAMVTVAPRGALIADARGQTQIGYGLIASYFYPGNEYIDLARETDNLVRQLQQGSPGLKRGSEASRYVQVSGARAMITPLESPSPYPGETEVDTLVTLSRPEGLFYMLLITPRSEWNAASRTLDDILRSLKFGN